MDTGRNDRNICRKGITNFTRYAFQGPERQGRDNGGNGLAPFGMAWNDA